MIADEMFTHRIRGDDLRERFTPRPRFRLLECRTRQDVATATLQSPRPIDYLTGLRLLGGDRSFRHRSHTARDELVFEILVSAAYEQSDGCMTQDLIAADDLSLGAGQHFVSIETALQILRSGGKLHLTDRELADSLQRLRSATAVLPSIPVPAVRMSPRLRQLGDYVASDDENYDPPPPIAPIAAEHFDIVNQATPAGLHTAVRKLLPPRSGQLGKLLTAMIETQPVDPSEDSEFVRFRPFTKLLMSSDAIGFELHPHLRDYLSRRRIAAWGYVPFVHLDLRLASRFQSPYTMPLYRQLLAQTYDPRAKQIRFDDVWTWETDAASLARAVGYRVQDGGLRAQVIRNVIEKAMVDLRTAGPDGIQIVLREKTTRSRSDQTLVFDIHLPLPSLLQHFGVRRSFHGRYIDKESKLEAIAAAKARSMAAAESGKTSRYTQWSRNLDKIFPAQVAPYSVTQLETLKRVENHLKLNLWQSSRMVSAWHLALDEIHNSPDAYYSDLTGRGAGRRHRGARLRRMIYEQGADRAFIRFALEEARDPDLSLPLTLDRLEFEGTVAAAESDRQYRLAEASMGFRPKRVERIRKLEGIDGYLAAMQAGRERSRLEEKEKNRVELARKKKKAEARRRHTLRFRRLKVPVAPAVRECDIVEQAIIDVGVDAAFAEGGKTLVAARIRELEAMRAMSEDGGGEMPSQPRLSTKELLSPDEDLSEDEDEDIDEDAGEDDWVDDTAVDDLPDDDLMVEAPVATPPPAPVASEPVTEPTPRPKPPVPAFLLQGTPKPAGPAWTDPYGTAKRGFQGAF